MKLTSSRRSSGFGGLWWALLHKAGSLGWQPRGMTAPKGAKTHDKTTNWTAYNAALKARGSLTIWLDKDMPWYAPASGKRGRQRIFSEAAIPFCLSIKCLFNLAPLQKPGHG
jgi:hypothetical protein